MLIPSNQLKSVSAKALLITGDNYKSKLEKAYASRLGLLLRSGKIAHWQYEPLKFRLGQRHFYTPDFFVITSVGEVELHEVKGLPREDARVKWKAAAEMFPFFRWFWVTRRRKEWVFEQYGRAST